MNVVPLAIPDVRRIEPRIFADERGHFGTSWNDTEFRARVADVSFVQDNLSHSRCGVIRGLHFQTRRVQGKLVQCASGAIWDVVVDVRRSSPTFGTWVAEELSAENHRQLWIPPGFAHGFLVLSDYAAVHYKVTDEWDPAAERTLLWDDPALAIAWPLKSGVAPVLSAKDRAGQTLHALEALP